MSLMFATTTVSGEVSSRLLTTIHTDENEIRTLGVVLSLAGGFMVSFVVVTGLYIYWRCGGRPYSKPTAVAPCPPSPLQTPTTISWTHDPPAVHLEMPLPSAPPAKEFIHACPCSTSIDPWIQDLPPVYTPPQRSP
ncbi:hypothetical protein CLU79DRAFT_836300 [Phycomyces nitens]|nr:hypothetical protein CLU79DRAFT_836300 [Phycomyces nitens]